MWRSFESYQNRERAHRPSISRSCISSTEKLRESDAGRVVLQEKGK
jgi:hypothetical protein